jgi:hypothetical protein
MRWNPYVLTKIDPFLFKRIEKPKEVIQGERYIEYIKQELEVYHFMYLEIPTTCSTNDKS